MSKTGTQQQTMALADTIEFHKGLVECTGKGPIPGPMCFAIRLPGGKTVNCSVIVDEKLFSLET